MGYGLTHGENEFVKVDVVLIRHLEALDEVEHSAGPKALLTDKYRY